MKKFNLITFLALTMIFLLASCTTYDNSPKETLNEIPEQSITYTDFTLGNVIQDGKQTLLLNFTSDFIVTQLKVTGTLLDKGGNTLHSFDVTVSLNNPSYNPELPVRIESGLVKYVESVDISKIKAYTLQQLDTNLDNELQHITTLNGSVIENFWASGSTITVTKGQIDIQLDDNHNSCGFRWDLSEINLKSNTKYLLKFYNINVSDIKNNSIQLETTWVDSTYTWPRYFNVRTKCFDIISRGEISSDYYQFLNSKTYDEYIIEFSFKHNVENAKSKSLYFNIFGVKKQLSISKLSIYEVM